MLFSVIIPFYNREQYIDEVLNSVTSQEYRDFELIAVDDGSTDGTLEKLMSDGRIDQVIAISNSGPSIARNKGAEQAKGQYLAFLDSDDMWFPFTLSLYEQTIEENDHPAVVTSRPVIFDDPKAIRVPNLSTTSVKKFSCYNESFDDRYWFGVSSFLIRKDSFQAVGGFTNRRMNAEDADLMLKLGTSPGFIHITQPSPFAYRRHSSNLTGDSALGLIGLNHLVQTEIEGKYPGGASDAKKRRIIITRHLRPAIIGGIRTGQQSNVWPLFKQTFFWNLRQGRFRYLAYCIFNFLKRAFGFS